jgi:uncharacterized protein (TIGR02001 family)
MKSVKLSFAIAAVLAALPLVSLAQEAEVAEAESPFSWSVAVASDYVFRGVSQTDEDPALQAGATYSFPAGFYVGAWGSNVDFGTGGPDIELDGIVGYNTDLSDQWNLDVSVVRYFYLNADSDYPDIDYNEYIAKLSYAATDTISLTGLVAYANDYSNTGADEFYYNLGSSFEVGNGFSLNLGAGYTSIEADGGGRADYFDGSVSVSRDFGPVNANLGYYDTFGSDADALKDGSDIYDSRVALLLTIAQ